MRYLDPQLEQEYDDMFSADIRQRDEWITLQAQESAWWLNDIMEGKGFDDNFNYEDYE